MREKGELKRFSITGLVIAYGINSLATTLAACTFSSLYLSCNTGVPWMRKSIGYSEDMSGT